MKSQAWSLDIMLAVVVFIGTALFFYSTLSQSQSTKVKDLENEAVNVLGYIEIQNSTASIIDNNEINITKLEGMLGKNYSEIKNKLRIKNDFCIYFEDKQGNIIYINQTRIGIGSVIINISSTPCG